MSGAQIGPVVYAYGPYRCQLPYCEPQDVAADQLGVEPEEDRHLEAALDRVMVLHQQLREQTEANRQTLERILALLS